MSFAKLDGLGGGYPYGLRSLFMALFGPTAMLRRCPLPGVARTLPIKTHFPPLNL
jgi:hypothetical protein